MSEENHNRRSNILKHLEDKMEEVFQSIADTVEEAAESERHRDVGMRREWTRIYGPTRRRRAMGKRRSRHSQMGRCAFGGCAESSRRSRRETYFHF